MRDSLWDDLRVAELLQKRADDSAAVLANAALQHLNSPIVQLLRKFAYDSSAALPKTAALPHLKPPVVQLLQIYVPSPIVVFQ